MLCFWRYLGLGILIYLEFSCFILLMRFWKNLLIVVLKWLLEMLIMICGWFWIWVMCWLKFWIMYLVIGCIGLGLWGILLCVLFLMVCLGCWIVLDCLILINSLRYILIGLNVFLEWILLWIFLIWICRNSLFEFIWFVF